MNALKEIACSRRSDSEGATRKDEEWLVNNRRARLFASLLHYPNAWNRLGKKLKSKDFMKFEPMSIATSWCTSFKPSHPRLSRLRRLRILPSRANKTASYAGQRCTEMLYQMSCDAQWLHSSVGKITPSCDTHFSAPSPAP